LHYLNDAEVMADLFAGKHRLFLGRELKDDNGFKSMPKLPGIVGIYVIGDRALRCAGSSETFYLAVVKDDTESEAIALALDAQKLAAAQVGLMDGAAILPAGRDIEHPSTSKVYLFYPKESEGVATDPVEVWIEDEQRQARYYYAIVDKGNTDGPDLELIGVYVALIYLAGEIQRTRPLSGWAAGARKLDP
jgi:hypothetical protein